MSEAESTQGVDDLAELKRQLDAERAKSANLERQLSTTHGEKVTAERRVVSEAEQRLLAQEQATDNAIAAAENEASALEAQLSTLWAEGKFAEAAAVQRKISQAETRLFNEKNRKDHLAGERERVRSIVEQQSQQRQPQGGGDLSMRTAAWIAAHPQFSSDPVYHNLAMAGHADAVKQGIPVDSDEYFAHIEGFTGDRRAPASGQGQRVASEGASVEQPLSQPQQGGELAYEPQRPQARAAGPGSLGAAPVSRQAPTSPAPGRQPDLTAEEREVADALYGHMAPKERYTKYAENRAFMSARTASQH